MKITIEIKATGTEIERGYRSHLTVGEIETCLGIRYSQEDAIRDSLHYLEQELQRGKWSKFALFQNMAGTATGEAAK